MNILYRCCILLSVLRYPRRTLHERNSWVSPQSQTIFDQRRYERYFPIRYFNAMLSLIYCPWMLYRRVTPKLNTRKQRHFNLILLYYWMSFHLQRGSDGVFMRIEWTNWCVLTSLIKSWKSLLILQIYFINRNTGTLQVSIYSLLIIYLYFW